MNILIFVASMYLAGAILNMIQICRLYYYFENELPFSIIVYTFFLIISHPFYVIVGIRNSFCDWNWMFNRLYRDEDGELKVRPKGEAENDV